jgi:hypothetical protein
MADPNTTDIDAALAYANRQIDDARELVMQHWHDLQQLRSLVRAAVWPVGGGMRIDTQALNELMRAVHGDG